MHTELIIFAFANFLLLSIVILMTDWVLQHSHGNTFYMEAVTTIRTIVVATYAYGGAFVLYLYLSRDLQDAHIVGVLTGTTVAFWFFKTRSVVFLAKQKKVVKEMTGGFRA